MFKFFPTSYRWSYNALLAFSAGAQLGDFALILPQLSANVENEAVWHESWTRLASVLTERAALGSAATASEDLFLAALFHTIGEHFLKAGSPERLQAYQRVLDTFERARALAAFPFERVSIPYERSSLPAYFLPSKGGGSAPTAIFICGLDTTKELWFLRAREQFRNRGINALFIDTPGIGEALRLQHFYTRVDYEVPVSAAIDYLITREDVDRERIGIVGSSLGGYYVTRAAAYEPRLKAVVAWGAIYDYHSVWERRMRQPATAAMGTTFSQLAFITGTESIEAAMDYIRDFRVGDHAARVHCPILIMHGAEDQQIPMDDAKSMFDAIASTDKELLIFSGENGGAAHTQFDNHLPALHIAADWLMTKLGGHNDTRS